MNAHSRRLAAAAVLAAGLLLFHFGSAVAHGVLRSSNPASGAHLRAAPTELRLTFSEAPEMGMARIGLTGPDGRGIALGALSIAGDPRMTLVAPIAGRLVEGPYTVTWQVAGADGHPVRGDFRFVIAPGAAGLADAVQPQAGGGPLAPAPRDSTAAHHNPVSMPTSATAFDSGSAGYVAVRWLLYSGLLALIGAVAFRTVVLALLRRRPGVGIEQIAQSTSRAARIGALAAWVLVVAVIGRLFAQSIALHGSRGATDLALVRSMLASTSWGRGWIVQAATVMVALVGFHLARQAGSRSRSRMGWTIATVAALVLAFTPGLASHAAASPRLRGLAMVIDGLHVLGAAGWLGSLMVVVFAGIPAALSLTSERRGPAVADLINAFSPTALFFAGLVAVSGVFAAWLHVGSISGLWQSTYGQLVLLKVGILSIVALTGAYNWLRVRPALGDIEGATRITRSATVEVAVAVVVLIVTAVLVATPTPMDM
ncbi:MAG: copper resistance protein CopC/CopD [Gemmatimonadaceae bacterium]|nr:copper resistance protein CopC/CopD [Gemmatimonadaceae bacterium]